jgi:hypothetical protein
MYTRSNLKEIIAYFNELSEDDHNVAQFEECIGKIK